MDKKRTSLQEVATKFETATRNDACSAGDGNNLIQQLKKMVAQIGKPDRSDLSSTKELRKFKQNSNFSEELIEGIDKLACHIERLDTHPDESDLVKEPRGQILCFELKKLLDEACQHSKPIDIDTSHDPAKHQADISVSPLLSATPSNGRHPMTSLRPVRGTRDLVGEEMRAHRHVVETAQRFAARYGYQEIATPIFEFVEVFARPLGETSDVVSKEMYVFEDRGGEKLTLRPEFTAGVARAFISGAFGQALPAKLFCSGPAFRYERPQKGRYRQFHQIDAEILGAPEPLADIEVIALGHAILSELGVAKYVTLELNSLGDTESRQAYREKLVGYLSRFKDDLSEDSQARLERNPLRILDSKNKQDREIVGEAPLLTDCFNEASHRFYEQVKEGLEALGVNYQTNPKLVRGLDYYSHTAFEFTTTELGAQGAVLAGGRYDGLIKTLGGNDTAGIGWAAGIERLSMLVTDLPPQQRTIAIVPMGAGMETEALKLAMELRAAGYHVDYGYKGKVGQRLKRAAQQNARLAVMLGEDELAGGKVILRDLDEGEQQEVDRSALEGFLSNLYS